MDHARLDAWLARAITALLIAILVTAPLAMGALRHQEFFWLQMLGVVAGILWVVRLRLNPQLRIFLPPMVWPLLGFCLYAVIRYFTADLEYLARKELVRVLFYLLFFLLCLNHFQNAKAADLAVGILIVIGMGMSVYALRQYLTGTSAVWHFVRPSYAFRGSGTFIYPNHFAGFAEMLLALGLAYVFLGSASKWVRAFLAYCSLWLVLGIYVSLSRAGWIAAVLSLLVLLPVFLRNRQRQIVAFGLCVALLVAGLVWEVSTGEISRRLKGVGGSDPATGFNVRGELWTAAYRMWQDHLWWGGGPGHFDERFRAYRTAGFQYRAGHAHCDYLEVLADWGIVGLLPLLSALALALWPLGRHWIKTVLDPAGLNAATSNYFALTCGGVAGILALLAHSLVDYQWYAPGVMLTFVAIIAMLLGQTAGERWTYPARRIIPLVLVVLLVFLAYQGGKSFCEHHWLDKSARAKALPAQIALLERAFAIEPTNFETAYLIGENYRLLSWEGAEDYRQNAMKGIEWLDRAARLNPFDPFPHLRKAMCLDWLNRPAEAEVAIQKALVLDPEHYLVLAIAGWHYFQVRDDKNTIKYLGASNARKGPGNPIVAEYFRLLGERLKQK